MSNLRKNFLIFIVLFTFGAVIGFNLIPLIEKQITENTEFVTYETPVLIAKESKIFAPCEKVPLKFVRTSTISTFLESHTNIVEVGGNRKVTRTATSGKVEPAKNKIVEINYDPTCLPIGKWKIEGVFKYNFRGVDKQFIWASEEFEIIN